jgi:hypothetical protein
MLSSYIQSNANTKKVIGNGKVTQNQVGTKMSIVKVTANETMKNSQYFAVDFVVSAMMIFLSVVK